MDNGGMKESFFWVDPEQMDGMPCFHGTRVPVDTLFDYLESGEPLAEFLDDFPAVSRESTIGVLEQAKATLADCGSVN